MLTVEFNLRLHRGNGGCIRSMNVFSISSVCKTAIPCRKKTSWYQEQEQEAGMNEKHRFANHNEQGESLACCLHSIGFVTIHEMGVALLCTSMDRRRDKICSIIQVLLQLCLRVVADHLAWIWPIALKLAINLLMLVQSDCKLSWDQNGFDL